MSFLTTSPPWQKRAVPGKIWYPVELSNPLPNYEGPRLEPFKHRNAHVQFLDLINAETPGEDGYVFEVEIESKRYALKVFKFYDPREDYKDLKKTQFELSVKSVIAQFDPFYSECRAYGHMESHRVNGVVAVRAHGFMDIPASMEGFLACFPFHANDWNRPKVEYSWPFAQRQPFRAIVKDLVVHKPNISNVARMREDLLTLQKIGVFVQDIKKANYCNGKLVDFSWCWTHPHIYVDPRLRSQDSLNEQAIFSVRRAFDRMLAAEGILTRAKAVDGPGYQEPVEEGDSAVEEKDAGNSVKPHTAGKLRERTKKPDRLGF